MITRIVTDSWSLHPGARNDETLLKQDYLKPIITTVTQRNKGSLSVQNFERECYELKRTTCCGKKRYEIFLSPRSHIQYHCVLHVIHLNHVYVDKVVPVVFSDSLKITCYVWLHISPK